MTAPTEPMTYFRRREFYGEFNTRPPRWHIHTGPPVTDYGVFRGLCGYTFGNLIGALLISRTRDSKPKGDLCSKCERKMASATPET